MKHLRIKIAKYGQALCTENCKPFLASGFLYISCTWSSLNFLDIWTCSSHQIWINVSHSFFTCFSLSSFPPVTSITQMLDSVIFHMSLRLCSCFFPLSLNLCAFWVVSIAVSSRSLIFPSAVPYLSFPS